MQHQELKKSVLKLVKQAGCISITSIMKELNYTEDATQQTMLFQVVYELVEKNAVTFSGTTDGFVTYTQVLH